MEKKNRIKNILYWVGNAAVGLLSLGVTYSDVILPEVFPENTIINKLAIPISAGLKFLWDRWKYRKGKSAPAAKKIYNGLSNKVTGEWNSKGVKSND